MLSLVSQPQRRIEMGNTETSIRNDSSYDLNVFLSLCFNTQFALTVFTLCFNYKNLNKLYYNGGIQLDLQRLDNKFLICFIAHGKYCS